MNKTYICIDLKTFFASVECVLRGLDPFETNLVVADPDRQTGTLCLAISPKMKAQGIKNRCRIYEIPKEIKYIMAKPRMSKYIEYSSQIYSIYLRFISSSDIHVYSIDEVFIDATNYLALYKLDAISLAKKLINEVYKETGITAAAGIGTNMYLTKIALDITAKHTKDNIGYLNQQLFLKELSNHVPLTDFWGIGKGISERLKKYGIYDMEGIRNIDPKKLYKEFGINAEILIDHSNGIEPCTIEDIKIYKPKNNSTSIGQVLHKDYNFIDAKTILKEMIDLLSLDLIDKELLAGKIGITIGYKRGTIGSTGCSYSLENSTNSYKDLEEKFMYIYNKTTDTDIPIRKITVYASSFTKIGIEQLDLFHESNHLEMKLEKTMNDLKKKFGKNSILRGISYTESGTARERNKQIGGHNAE
ncbi:MAG: DNA repair protein [Bacilli bacterium]